ncbi:MULTISPECIES: serine--tRNA ligase [Nitrospirillum]|uniref:Serine--tRNA ligase n=1 Tax=Nitrospirillum amazonense TaxID=28077 RepID=A0A560GCT3_9PROT|nr:serine--tRNA ligase [Nitrospirillum amazonense]MEC4594891.1 serine--tRNA ligase [Nitrospirillum amazonense]TWB31722.1 seryl-tRNA synthetase [Nitrospirillum amazonense]
MHDLRVLRDNPEAFDGGLARRGLPPQSAVVLDLDARRRAAQTALQDMQARRNEASKLIGAYKKDGKDAQPLMDEVASLKEGMAEAEATEKALSEELDRLLSTIPNLPATDVPQGKDEHDNVERHRVGTPSVIENAKEHFDLGEALGFMDFSAAAKLSGARFTVLKGPLARLERALGDFMLDTHTREFGYTEVSPPLMVRDEAAFGTGQLPKFAEDLFQTNTGHWLIPTAEVPLTNLVADSILDAEELPLRMTARTPCFRAEAGAAGRDTRGMIRQHQFYKVEMVSVTTPDQSAAEHERMTEAAETVLKRLGLPFRTVTLCTGDMGFSAAKTYDIEVWLPGQNMYREISSCSNCGDFQARRMKARWRNKGDKNTQFVHTLNGSGVAVGRALLAVMENYQEADGSIRVPEVLVPYMNGLERIVRG